MPDFDFEDLVPKAEAPKKADQTDFEDLVPKQGYLGAIGRGIKKGLNDFLLAPGYAESGVMNATQIPGTTEQMKDVPNPVEENAAMGPSEHPIVESIAEGMGNPASWFGPGGMVSKGVGIVGSTLGGEAGRHFAKGSAFEIPAELAGSFAGGHAALAPPKLGAPLKSIAPDRQALIDTLKGEGVTSLTAGQQRGSKGLRYLESITADSPLSGTGAEEINDAAKKQFTGAVLKRMGEDADAATPDVIQRARDRIGDKFDEVAKKLPVKFTKDFGDKLVQIEQDMMKEGLPADSVNRVVKNIENVRNGFNISKPPSAAASQRGNLNRPINQQTLDELRGQGPLGASLAQGVSDINAKGGPSNMMPGSTYQMLTRKNSPLDRLLNSQNADEKFYGGQIRDAIDEAMSKTATGQGTREGTGRRQALADLKEARRQWRTMILASKAVAGGGEDAAKGYISPAQLRAQLASSPKDKLNYAQGGSTGGLGKLSRAGNAIMSPLPNSGTSQREQAREMFNLATTLKGSEPGAAGGAALGGLAGGIPGALIGAAAGPFATGAAGRILHSQPVQKYLTNQLPGQEWIREHRPGASPAWLSMVNVLRNQGEQQ